MPLSNIQLQMKGFYVVKLIDQYFKSFLATEKNYMCAFSNSPGFEIMT